MRPKTASDAPFPMRRQLIEYVFECGPESFSVYASNREDAFDKACAEANDRNLHDERLRLVDEMPHDPNGGDGPDD